MVFIHDGFNTLLALAEPNVRHLQESELMSITLFSRSNRSFSVLSMIQTLSDKSAVGLVVAMC